MQDLPNEIDVDGILDDSSHIKYLGKAVKQPNGNYNCLAIVGDSLCRVEVIIMTELEQLSLPHHEPSSCDHGVTFDEEAADDLDCVEIRKRWPRLFGKCPKGCGFEGIAYASKMHYVYGDW